jgi:SpoVK/Ycf46/Vps4 family AAA+-type ATPase
MLWGDPGCGKTGFIKALSNHDKLKDKHIINIKLSTLFDFNVLNRIIFSEKINRELIIPLNKRIIVLEDIDCMCEIIKERDENNIEIVPNTSETNKNDINDLKKMYEYLEKKENNNNLSYLLNIIDGLKESSERIIIITTNHPEKIDKALTRSGRIDIKINFKRASYDDIKNIIEYYWEISTNEIKKEWTYLLTHADIIKYCKLSNSFPETLNLISNNLDELCCPKDLNIILKNFYHNEILSELDEIKITYKQLGELCYNEKNNEIIKNKILNYK